MNPDPTPPLPPVLPPIGAKLRFTKRHYRWTSAEVGDEVEVTVHSKNSFQTTTPHESNEVWIFPRSWQEGLELVPPIALANGIGVVTDLVLREGEGELFHDGQRRANEDFKEGTPSKSIRYMNADVSSGYSYEWNRLEALKEEPLPSDPVGEPENDDTCAASGVGCMWLPLGPKGEIQCRFCGRGVTEREAKPEVAESSYGDICNSKDNLLHELLKRDVELTQANAAVGRLRSLLESVQQASIDPMGIKMAKVMEEIHRELNTPPAPDGWRGISESLPREGEEVLFICEINGSWTDPLLGTYNGKRTAGDAIVMDIDGDDWFPCDHWMPLPKPPTGKRGVE